jgi:phosphoglycolate phosphatase
MQKIVIFDMDGTLIDSKKDITISINHVRKTHYNLPPLSENFVVEAINMEERNLPKLFYDTEIYTDQDRVLFEEHYAIQCTQNLHLYDGILTMLQNLKEHGVKLSVATNAPTKFAQKMLAHLQVASYFDVIIGADKATASKPDPNMLYTILDSYDYNVEKDAAWMIGDNSKDIQSAINANIYAIFATWGFSSHSEYETVIQTPKEVLNIIL